MRITDALRAEHAIYLGVFAEIERAVPRLATIGELRTMAAIIERVLAPHAAAENNLAFLALDHVLSDQGQLQRLYHEHKEIDERLKQVHSVSNCGEARRLLLASIGASREHFRLEEAEVFPLLEKRLKPETLRELGQKWRERRSEAPASPS